MKLNGDSKKPIKNRQRRFFRYFSYLMYFCWGIIIVLFLYFGIYKACMYPIKYKEQVIFYSKEYQVEPELVFAVIKTESSFKVNAESQAGAKGLMQITDSTGGYIAQKLGVEEFDLFDAETNVNFGCYYLKYLLNKFESLDTALGAYNAGEGKVNLWLQDANFSKDGKNLDYAPYPETQNFIKNVKKSVQTYRKLYGNILDKA